MCVCLAFRVMLNDMTKVATPLLASSSSLGAPLAPHEFLTQNTCCMASCSYNNYAVAIGPVTGRPFLWLLVQQLVTCKAQIANANQIHAFTSCCVASVDP